MNNIVLDTQKAVVTMNNSKFEWYVVPLHYFDTDSDTLELWLKSLVLHAGGNNVPSSFNIIIRGLNYTSPEGLNNSRRTDNQLVLNFVRSSGEDYDEFLLREFDESSSLTISRANFLNIGVRFACCNDYNAPVEAATVSSDSVIATKLFGYFFNLPSNVDVSSPIGYDLTLLGNCPYALDSGFNSVVFSGDDTMILSQDDLLKYNQVSISCWFKTSSAAEQCLIGLSDQDQTDGDFAYFKIFKTTSGKLCMLFADNDPLGTASFFSIINTLDDGAWHHAVCVFGNEGFRQIWIDGVLDNSDNSVKSLINIETTMLSIGGFMEWTVLDIHSEADVLGSSYAHYPMVNGSITNDAVGAYHATNVNGAYQLQSGRDSVFLNGTNAHFDLTPHISAFHGLANKTVAGWIYTSSTASQTIYSLNNTTDTDHFRIWLDTSSNLVVSKNGVDVTTSPIALSAWQHIAIVHGAMAREVYLNGSSVYSSAGVSNDTYEKCYIGVHSEYVAGTYPTSYDTIIEDANLLCQYKFNNNGDDETTNNIDATLRDNNSGTELPIYGSVSDGSVSRQCITFQNVTDSSTDSTFLGLDSHVATFDNLKSVSFWMRGTQASITSGQTIFSIRDTTQSSDRMLINVRLGEASGADIGQPRVVGFLLQDVDGGLVRYQIKQAELSIGDMVWHHYVLNFSNGTHQIYMDGVLLTAHFINGSSTDALQMSDITGENRVAIGASPGTLANPLASYGMNSELNLSEMLFYDRILTQSEVTSLYNEVAGTVGGSSLTDYYHGNISKMSFYSTNLTSPDVTALQTESIEDTGAFVVQDDFVGSLSEPLFFNRRLLSNEIDALANQTVDASMTFPHANFNFQLK